MMGKPVQRAAKLFHIGFDLDERVPADHPLRRVEAAVDFSFVRPLVAPAYGRNGHESLDPTLVLKLLFLCFYENVRSERELLRQLPLRLDWLWFCGLSLDDAVPDHSVLSKARRRWGPQCFEAVFETVLGRCQAAGLVGGQTVHADSTLLKANAALEGRVSRILWQQLEAAQAPALASAPPPQDPRDGPGAGSPPPETDPQPTPAGATTAVASAGSVPPPPKPQLPLKLNQRLVSPVDPDAATSTRKARGTMLGYRDHRLIDDQCGIILATLATAADRDDGVMLPELLARSQASTGTPPREVVGDSMYGTQANYQHLAQRRIKAYLKKRRGKDSPKVSWLACLPAGCTPGRARHLMGRRRSVAEGRFAEAHVRMDHRRCRWRRQWRVQIQCYLVATVQNLKKLAQTLGRRAAAGVEALIPHNGRALRGRLIQRQRTRLFPYYQTVGVF